MYRTKFSFLCTLQKNGDVRKNGYKENVPPAGPTPGRDNASSMFSGLGAHEESKKKLAEERKREYNEKISQVSLLFSVTLYRLISGY